MTTIYIKGMSCMHCVNSTRKALEKIPEILDVTVDLKKGEARYSGDVDVQVVKDAIVKIGFEVV